MNTNETTTKFNKFINDSFNEIFKRIDNPSEYVENLISNGYSVQTAQKTARIHAYQCNEEKIIKTKLKDGTVETTNTARPGDWIITNPDGEQYVVTTENFKKKYEHDKNDIYKPKGAVQQVIQIDENISFNAPWGENMNLKKGAWLVITDRNDIYGIAQDEFNKTYKIEISTNKTKNQTNRITELKTQIKKLEQIKENYKKTTEKTLLQNPATQKNILNKKLTENLSQEQINSVENTAVNTAENYNKQNINRNTEENTKKTGR